MSALNLIVIQNPKTSVIGDLLLQQQKIFH